MARKTVKTIAIILSAVLLLSCVAAAGYLGWLTHSPRFVRFDKGKLNEVCANVTFLDNDGKEIEDALSLNNSKQVPLAALHDYTYMAFVAVEDKRFFSHGGIDVRRVFGAVWHNLKSRSFKEGASTISQQLIKNTHLDNNKNLSRKVNEMILARQLEKEYSKREILEMYLNTIYFGRNAYGVENAANVYFDKSAKDLTVAESATLAAMIKAPNVYAPDKNVEKCLARRNLVLKLMREQQIVDEESYQSAICEEIVFSPYTQKRETTYLQKAVAEACRLLNMTESQLYHSGFVAETYFEPKLQANLYKAAESDPTLNLDGSLPNLACLLCGKDGGVAACYLRGDTGARQVGSTLKPIAVYTPALAEKLICQASPVLDEFTDFGGYSPKNAGGNYCGWTTIKNAVVKSLNVPAVKTLNSLGLGKAEIYLQKLGFSGEQNLSLALGNIAGGMTAEDLLHCYTALANGGTCSDIAYIKHICSTNGEIYTRKPQKAQVFDERATYLMTDMLKATAQAGTAKQLANLGYPIAAKTGTVGDARGNSEAIVAGYTTQHTFVFWHSGQFDNSVSGSTAPCKLAEKVLSRAYDTPPQDFAPPFGVMQLNIDRDNLYNRQLVELADDEDGESFWFDQDNRPTKFAEPIENYEFEGWE